ASTSAADITANLNANNQITLANLNLSSPNQYEWFKLTIPSWKNGMMAVQMQSSNLSELSPRLAVFDANLVNSAQALAANSYGATVEVDFSVSAGQTYYIRASAANGAPTDMGAFGIQVNIGLNRLSPIPPPNTTVAAQSNQGGGMLNLGTGGSVLDI